VEKNQLYKVSFINGDKVYEVFAKQVYESDLYGFVVIEELVFGSKSDIVIDPAEEKLQNEFDSVRRTFVPIHSIIRIDEVEKQGTSKIHDYKSTGNVTAFPSNKSKPSNFTPET
jgi:hypothetical protein